MAEFLGIPVVETDTLRTPTGQIGWRGLAISGKQLAGKDTLVLAVQSLLAERGHSSEHLTLAGPLKCMFQDAGCAVGLDTRRPDWKHVFRRGLQELGKSARSVNPLIWIDLLRHRIQQTPKFVLVSDLRFQNEAAALKEDGFLLGRISSSRELRAARGPLQGEDDLSERDLDDYTGWDFVIDQDGDIAKFGHLPTPEVYAKFVVEQVLGINEKSTRDARF